MQEHLSSAFILLTSRSLEEGTQMRRTVLCFWRVAAFAMLIGASAEAQVPTGASAPDYHPMVEIQREDLAQARSHFTTKILRSGPPPAEWDDLIAPTGAHEVTYPSGALRLKAWIGAPVSGDATKHAAILFLHSGFDLEAGDWDLAQPFRNAGYVVMMPTMRGENGQHGVFTMYYNEVDDVIYAAEYLRSQSFVDPDQMFVAGYSVGGVLALLAAEIYPYFRAAASISGSPDQALYLKYAKGARLNAPFDPDDLREVQLRSPLAYAASFKCPIRLYYGTEEAYYTFVQARTAEIARAHGVDAQAIAVEGDHGSNVPKSIQVALGFFNKKMHEKR
jgi:dipeptidyl aminopeptidase/acylaminoacyl peptidase